MNSIENDLSKLDKELNKTEQNIITLEGNIEVKTAEVNERNKFLDGRLRQMYVEGDVSYLDVLFESTSLTDFLTRYDLMGKVVENDMEMLAGLKVEREQLEQQKVELEAAKTELTSIKSQQESKHQTLASQTEVKEGLLSTLESDKAEIDAALDELEAAQKEIEKFVANIQSKYAFAYMGSGTMGWPVPGRTRISSSYGYRIHPITKKRSFHTGIDIPAPKNTPIRAAEKGKVIFAANNGAYGKTVILDHGGGMSTQYSHLNTIGVSVGNIVLKGDSVGGCGTTGWSTGNHLHFTIMKNGKTVQPLDYVKKP
jgi:murein DD-endopeptidase MepM/ murein hydrolase activator NlpD